MIRTYTNKLFTYAILEGEDDHRIHAGTQPGRSCALHIEGARGRLVRTRNADDVEAFGRYLADVVAPTMRGGRG